MIFEYPKSKINTIYLMMGMNCNFKCRHCIQECSSKVDETDDISTEVIEYIWHLINIRPDNARKLHLMFWGGEPLLYLDKINKVVTIFKDNLSYSLVTNGSLLTDEIVEFLNQHNIRVALSYDGKHTESIRGINILDNPKIVECFKGIANKSICAVLSAYNYDLKELFAEIDDRFGIDTPIYVEPLRVTWDMPDDLYNVDLVDFQNKIHSLAEKAVVDILNIHPSREIDFFLPYLRTLCRGNKTPLNCNQIYFTINIDLSGNIYACHNSNKIVGNTSTPRYTLVNNQDEFVAKLSSDQCTACDYFSICNGGCPLEISGDDGYKLSCTLRKIIYKEVLWINESINNSFCSVDL